MEPFSKFKNASYIDGYIGKGNIWFKRAVENDLAADKREEYLKKALESYEMASNEISGKIGLANCFYKNNQYELAENLYDEVIKNDENNFAANLGKANCLYKLKKLEEAKKFYIKAKMHNIKSDKTDLIDKRISYCNSN